MEEKKNRKHPQTGEKKSTVRRLFVANAVALLALLTVTVTVLFFLGLLESVFAFIF